MAFLFMGCYGGFAHRCAVVVPNAHTRGPLGYLLFAHTAQN